MTWMLQGATPLAHGAPDAPVDVVIDADRIAAVGEELDPAAHGVERTVDARGKLMMPGLVNAHLHSHDRFDRGRFDNLPLEIWRSVYQPPLEPRGWTPRECYLRTIVNGIELLRGGTTTVIDDVHHGLPFDPANVEAVFSAYRDLGLRAQVTVAHADRPFATTIPFLEELVPAALSAPRDGVRLPTTEEVLELWSDLASRWRGRVRFVLSPSAPERCTPGFLEATWQRSEAWELPVVVHVLETQVQAVAGRDFYGRSLVEHLDALGALTSRSVLVHCVWVEPRDIEMIAGAGASVVHSPGSNLKLGSGIAPVRRMLDAGIAVGLGTDNNSANDAASMLEATKLAALLHKVRAPSLDRWLGADDALRMATEGGARCAGLADEVGVIAPGRKADLVLLDLGALPWVPANDLVHQLVFAEHGASIDSVVIDGAVVMERGRIVTVDEEAVLAELAERAPDIRAKIGRTEPAGRALRPYLEEAYAKSVERARELGVHALE